MIEQVLPNLFRMTIPLPDSPLKYLNSYLIKGPDRNLIIDTGLNRRACISAMEEALEELAVDVTATDFFITHLHADHFGSVGRIASESSLILFNEVEIERVKAWQGWEPHIEYARMNGFPEDELRDALENHPGFRYRPQSFPELTPVKEGDKLTYGDYTFTCITTPGHSFGHTCLYDPSRKLLVCGDHILVDITPNIQCWWDNDDPLSNYLANLDRIAELEVELALPGHRRLITDCRGRIEELRRHHQARADEIVAILKSGPRNAHQTAARMTWDIRADSWAQFPVAQKWFATGEALAHLRYLEMAGRIGSEVKNGLIVYDVLSA